MQARQVELVIRRPGHPERRMVLEAGRLVIGRAEDADIVLADVGVSRRHARLVVDGGGIVVEDTGSGNGTWYRGKRIQRQVVGEGDEVFIDPFTLAFRAGGAEGADVTNGRDATVRMGGAAAVGARLEMISEHKNKGQTWTLPDAGVVTIGRSEKNDVVILEPGASRVHAEVGNTAGTYWVRDRGSANGTWVNKERADSRALEDGDVIRIGTVELRFTRPHPAGEDRTENFDGVMFTDFQGQRPGEAPIAAKPPPPPPAPPNPTATFAPQPSPVPPAPTLAPAPAPVPPPPPALRPALVSTGPMPLRSPGPPIERSEPQPRRGAPAKAGPNVALVAVAVLAVLGLLGSAVVCAGVVGWQVWKAQRPPAVATRTEASSPEVEQLLADGRKLFAEDKLFEAAAKFYQVLKIDPQNAEAERLAFVACEFVVVDRLREDLRAKAAAPAAPEAAAAAPAAPAPKQARPSSSSSRRGGSAEEYAARGQAAWDRGDYAGAVKAWQQAMAADPSRSSAAWYDAEEGIRRAKDKMREESRPHYAVGLEAQREGDLLTAREAFKETVRIDPYNETAAARLREVEAALKREGYR
ncbi:MAG: FHA domain-containing protein [Myxococcota bacterium]